MCKVSALCLTLDRPRTTELVINKIMANARSDTELLVWDNGSVDKPDFNKLPARTVIEYPENIGIGAALNQLLLRMRGEYFIHVSPSTILPPGWDTRLVTMYESLGSIGALATHNSRRNFEWVPGPVVCSYLVRRSWLEKVGAYCEDYVYGYNDVDFTSRLYFAGGINAYSGLLGYRVELLQDDPVPAYFATKREHVKRSGAIFRAKDYKQDYYISPPKMKGIEYENISTTFDQSCGR